MSNWVHKAIEQAKEKAEAKDAETAWLSESGKIVRSQGPDLFGKLAAVVRGDLEKLKTKLGLDARFSESSEPGASSFQVVKEGWPKIQLEVQFNPGGRCITFGRSIAQNAFSDHDTYRGLFTIGVDKKTGHLCVFDEEERSVSLPDVSQALLDPFLPA